MTPPVTLPGLELVYEQDPPPNPLVLAGMLLFGLAWALRPWWRRAR